MKYLTKSAKTIYVLVFILIVACGGDNVDPDPDPQPTLAELQSETTKKLTGTWSLSSITRDGSDVSSEFSGFTISFTSSGYSTSNGGGIWTDSGTWSFKSNSADTIINENGAEISLVFSNNDTQLTMAFIADTTLGIGRTSGIGGSYVFVVNK